MVYQQLLKLGLRRLFEQQSPVVGNATNAPMATIQSVSPSLAESISLASANVPTPPKTRKMTVTLEENGQRQQIEIDNPPPTLIDAIQSHRIIR